MSFAFRMPAESSNGAAKAAPLQRSAPLHAVSSMFAHVNHSLCGTRILLCILCSLACCIHVRSTRTEASNEPARMRTGNVKSSWVQPSDASFVECERSPRAPTDSAPCEVVHGLFLGSGRCTWSLDDLKAKRITHIVNAAPQVEACAHTSCIEYLKVEVLDDPSERICEHFARTNDFIDRARARNKRVLVHCHSGISRGAALVLAYLVDRESMELSCALSHLQKLRWAVSPNIGFMNQLEEFASQVSRRSLDRTLLSRNSSIESDMHGYVGASVRARPDGSEEDCAIGHTYRGRGDVRGDLL